MSIGAVRPWVCRAPPDRKEDLLNIPTEKDHSYMPTAMPSTTTHTTTRRVPLHVESRSNAPRGVPRVDIRRTAKRLGVDNAAILQERARIARDLHDSVSQTFYAIVLTASRALSLLDQNDGSDVQHIIDDILRLANTGQSELRALMTDIRSDQGTSGGLTDGLVNLAADVRTRTGLDIHLSVAHEQDVGEATEALLLISREALHNVAKHSRAQRVDIVLEASATHLVLLITDNGRGFDPAVSRPGHFGLQSMRERAWAVGATLELSSADGLGTQIRVCLPIERNQSCPSSRLSGPYG